jgi:glycerol-1-phosphate dehydrogenase [NAD(P)+]
VGIGTLASLALYEQLLGDGAGSGKRWDIDIQRAVDNWPSPETLEACIDSLFDGQLAAKAKEETRAKYIGRDELRAQLVRLHENWPQLRRRLARQLLSFAAARDMLRAAGCPSQPEQVGVSRPRLRLSYRQAYFIRRRFTVLDFAERCALLEAALEDLFSPEGIWAEAPQAETCARQGAAR